MNALLVELAAIGVAAPVAVSGRFAVNVSFVPGWLTCSAEYAATPLDVGADTVLEPLFVSVPAVGFSVSGRLALDAVNGPPLS